MSPAILLIAGWILVVTSTAVLLKYRLLLRHYDRRVLQCEPALPNPLHTLLRNRMMRIDLWGVSLTIAIFLYGVLFAIYLLYQPLARIAHGVLELLSYI